MLFHTHKHTLPTLANVILIKNTRTLMPWRVSKATAWITWRNQIRVGIDKSLTNFLWYPTVQAISDSGIRPRNYQYTFKMKGGLDTYPTTLQKRESLDDSATNATVEKHIPLRRSYSTAISALCWSAKMPSNIPKDPKRCPMLQNKHLKMRKIQNWTTLQYISLKISSWKSSKKCY